jgi:hypothetical protein
MNAPQDERAKMNANDVRQILETSRNISRAPTKPTVNDRRIFWTT